MKKYWGLLVVLFLSLGAIVPLLRPGFFPIHDNTQVVRVQQMAQALGDGQLPVRWVADLGYGYGYPIFNFYAPLAYYCGGFLSFAVLDVLLATKLMFIVGILLAGVFMYYSARELWGEMGGVLSGLFYVYAPYHAVDIYVRGSVGEFWAMAFLPLVFYSLYKLGEEKGKRWLVVAGISYAAVILSHNLMVIMTLPFILLSWLLIVVFLKNKRLYVVRSFFSGLLAFGLTAFYWLPALREMSLTKVFSQIGGGADWRDHFVFFDQLWASPWGFGGSAPGRLDGISFMLGKFHFLFVILALITASWLFKKGDKKKSFVILFAFAFLFLSLLLTNQASSPIWSLVPYWAFIQYPWRFLALASLAASFLAGAVTLWLKNKKPGLVYLIGGMIALGLLLFNYKYFQPQQQLRVTTADYLSEERIKWETSKISDEYLPKDFPVPQNKNEVAWGKIAVLAGEAEVKNPVLQSHQYSFDITAGDKVEVLINTAFFPGWRVWLDGKEVDFTLESGKIKMTPPPGEHQVLVRLTDTPIRRLANLISLISGIGLGALMLKWKYGRT